MWGLEVGYCMMVGRQRAPPSRGLRRSSTCSRRPTAGQRMGGHGSGHYVKMVHNGIEYGLMQAYGEGFEILHASDYELDLPGDRPPLEAGLRDPLLAARAGRARVRADGGDLEGIRGYVDDSGEGRWTVERRDRQERAGAGDHARLLARFASRQDESYSAKVHRAALRNQFGGHAVESTSDRSQLGPRRWAQENPLVGGPASGCPVHPTTLIIFGGTGDLAQRKLLPAIYNLAHEGALPERFNLIAVCAPGHPARRLPRVRARVRSASSRAGSPTRRCSTVAARARALRAAAPSTTTRPTSR